MDSSLVVLIIATIGGFLVSLGTELVIGQEKARKYPGGSMTFGFITAVSSHAEVGIIVLSVVFGMVGWILYRVFMPRS